MAGAGARSGRVIDDVARLVSEYGGPAEASPFHLSCPAAHRRYERYLAGSVAVPLSCKVT